MKYNSFFCIVCFTPMNGENQSNDFPTKNSKMEWLETMRAKHNQNVKEMNGKRLEKLKAKITKKALAAISEESIINMRTMRYRGK